MAYALYDDIDEILIYNNSLIESICQEHILHKTVTIRTNDKPWMSNEVRYFFFADETVFFLKKIKEHSPQLTSLTFILRVVRQTMQKEMLLKDINRNW